MLWLRASPASLTSRTDIVEESGRLVMSSPVYDSLKRFISFRQKMFSGRHPHAAGEQARAASATPRDRAVVTSGNRRPSTMKCPHLGSQSRYRSYEAIKGVIEPAVGLGLLIVRTPVIPALAITVPMGSEGL